MRHSQLIAVLWHHIGANRKLKLSFQRGVDKDTFFTTAEHTGPGAKVTARSLAGMSTLPQSKYAK
jgi:hypothetical protein